MKMVLTSRWKPVLLCCHLYLSFITARAGGPDTIRVLFIGNSLTYVNDLPAIVAGLGRQDNSTIIYKTFAFPDYSLDDHLAEGKIQPEIEQGKYDFVVAQQGPSALPESQRLLLNSAIQLAELCNKNKTRLALYMVWPSKVRLFDLDSVISSYHNAAEKTSSLICPAGLAWKLAWQADPALPLYSFDNFHPSVTGSVLAALIIYGTLAQKNNFDFIDRTRSSWQSEITSGRLKLLEQSALKAMNK